MWICKCKWAGNSSLYFDKPEDYEPLNDFHEGLAIVKKNGAFGYVDKEGKSTFDVAANKTQQNSTIMV